jgi:hypothetical protein
MLNLFQHNEQTPPVILKQVQDDEREGDKRRRRTLFGKNRTNET